MASNTGMRQYIQQNTQEEKGVSERSTEGYLTVCICRKGGNGRVGRRGRAVRLSLTSSAKARMYERGNLRWALRTRFRAQRWPQFTTSNHLSLFNFHIPAFVVCPDPSRPFQS